MGWAKYAEDIRIQKEEKIDWREIHGYPTQPYTQSQSDYIGRFAVRGYDENRYSQTRRCKKK